MILQTFLTVKRILIIAKNSFQTSKRNQQRKTRAKGSATAYEKRAELFITSSPAFATVI